MNYTSRALLSAILACLIFGLRSPSFSEEPRLENSGKIDNGQVFGFDYVIEGIELGKHELMAGNQAVVDGVVLEPLVTVSGVFRLSAGSIFVNDFAAQMIASSREYDENGRKFAHIDYICDGPVLNWRGSLDGRGSDSPVRQEVPFRLAIPVPHYDLGKQTTHIYLLIELGCTQHEYRPGADPASRFNFCRLSGKAAIPRDLEIPEIPPAADSHIGAPGSEPAAPPVAAEPTPELESPKSGTRYRFEELIVNIGLEWSFSPPTADSFPKLTSADRQLDVVVVVAELTVEQLMQNAGMEAGEPSERIVGGRNATYIPLERGNEGYGAILTFEQAMQSGNLLHVIFLNTEGSWDKQSWRVKQIIRDMRFTS